MSGDRYFIFNNREAFSECVLMNLEWVEDVGLALKDRSEQGLVFTPVLDCAVRDNRWQRVLVRASRPGLSQIGYRFFSFDRQYEAESAVALIRDGKLEVREKVDRLVRFEAFRVGNSDDYLLDTVKGRFLIVMLELIPHEFDFPTVSQIQVFASQESFLEYLPEIFQEEGGFLDRFIRLFSVQYAELERSINNIGKHFNPVSAPESMLTWLAETAGVENAELWERGNLRKLLMSGIYSRKGTFCGLAELIELYTGYRPYIIECFRMRTEPYTDSGLYKGGGLLILMPPGYARSHSADGALDTLIEGYIYAGLRYRLITLDDCIMLSGHSYLGINTRLAEYDQAVLELNSRLEYVTLGE